MKIRYSYGALIVLPLIMGCGSSSGGTRFDPASLVPAVDNSLPKEAQARQQVVRNLLKNLQEGYPVDRLKKLVPGVKFNETQSRFMEGARSLDSWRFNGQPSGDEVPVTLVFSPEGAGDEGPKQVERVYVVKESAGQFTVSRK
jgi:hypothetical protein